eukprot:TRINITY_DN17076_c0_g1_i1.p1 TRINITY_DN17076_c0_g1~~TRINITY_DN17076_c0_g1_i1.p1  ORF type:complete len:565 (-),score=86.38 TRINITY_DN17076_c0_g1_i1:115-1731(-)
MVGTNGASAALARALRRRPAPHAAVPRAVGSDCGRRAGAPECAGIESVGIHPRHSCSAAAVRCSTASAVGWLCRQPRARYFGGLVAEAPAAPSAARSPTWAAEGVATSVGDDEGAVALSNEDARRLLQVPFDGAPADCLRALAALASRRQSGELWDEASRQMLRGPLARQRVEADGAGHGRRWNAGEMMAVLRIWASAHRVHNQLRHAPWDGLLETIIGRLSMQASSLTASDARDLSRSCVQLQLPLPPRLAAVAASAVTRSSSTPSARTCSGSTSRSVDLSAVVYVLGALALARQPLSSASARPRGVLDAATSGIARLSRELRSQLASVCGASGGGGVRVGKDDIRLMLRHCVAYLPVVRGPTAATHAAILRAILHYLAISTGSLRFAALPRYLAYLRWCSCGGQWPWLLQEACDALPSSRRGAGEAARLLLDALDEEAVSMVGAGRWDASRATAAAVSASAHGRLRASAPARGAYLQSESGSSALEKDVMRVLAGVLRRGGHGAAVASIHSQEHAGALHYTQDYVLPPGLLGDAMG